MENQENQNSQVDPINSQLFSPIKDSPYKNVPRNKDYKLYQSFPFQSNIELNFTPSKKNNLSNVYCQSLGDTPIILNMNFPFSPISNNLGGDSSYQRMQYQQRSPFQPILTSPNNNQKISYKK